MTCDLHGDDYAVFAAADIEYLSAVNIAEPAVLAQVDAVISNAATCGARCHVVDTVGGISMSV